MSEQMENAVADNVQRSSSNNAVKRDFTFLSQVYDCKQVFCLYDVYSPLPFRFVRNVSFHADGCWEWTGPTIFNPKYPAKKYGVWDFRVNQGTPQERRTSTPAHRFAYTALVGPVSQSLDIDHLCENKLCVNPEHLEPVTRSENMLRVFRRRAGGAQ